MVRKAGFYKVLVTELGPPFWTIGLWEVYSGFGDENGYWKFADGDGHDTGSGFRVVEVNEEMIMVDREYKD